MGKDHETQLMAGTGLEETGRRREIIKLRLRVPDMWLSSYSTLLFSE